MKWKWYIVSIYRLEICGKLTVKFNHRVTVMPGKRDPRGEKMQPRRDKKSRHQAISRRYQRDYRPSSFSALFHADVEK